MPLEYIEYKLCEKFGWTPMELDEIPRHKVLEFLTIINIESQFKNLEDQKQAAKMKGR